MADIAINILVATVAERLSSLLIQEYGVLAEQANRVEWIERELRLMHPFLEHLERQRQNDDEDVNKWADELREVLRDAKDAIETFINKSVKGRRNMFFNVVTRLKFGKELRRIRHRILDVSVRRNIGVVVETPAHGGESSSTTPDTTVTPTVKKLDYVLTQSFLTRWKVINIVKQVREKFIKLHNILAIVESIGESSEREKIWRDDIKDLCNFTQVAVEDFIDTRERRCNRMGELKGILSPFVRHTCQTKLEKKMKTIETQIGDAYNRRSSYGFEEYAEDEKGEMKSTSRVHPLKTIRRFLNWRTILAAVFFNLFNAIFTFLIVLIWIGALIIPLSALVVRIVVHPRNALMAVLNAYKLWPFLIFNFLLYFLILLSFEYFMRIFVIIAFPLLVKGIVEFVAICCFDLEQDMQSIQRDIRLMHALTIDSESGEGLNERQRVWVEQIKVVAQQGEALCAEYELRKPQAANLVIRHSLGRKINYMLNKIGNVLERKIIYGIANIEERKGLVSLGQSTQGSEINSGSHDIMTEQNENCGTEEHPPSSLQHMNPDYHPVNGLKEKVQSIREELQLMNALFKDVQEMEQLEQLDRRVRIWVDQMRGIAEEIRSVIDDYIKKFEHKQTHIFNYFPSQYVMKKKIKKIRKKIEDASRRRKTYDLERFQTRAESFSMVQRLRQRTHPSLLVKESSIIGFDDDIDVLRAQLLSNEERLCVTSIVGIGGTGKTTIARFIFNNDAVVDHFHHRVWVSVPKNYVLELLLEDIAKQIMGVQEVKWTAKEELTQILNTVLANKRYLIVVDDVQTSQWDSLKKAIPDMSTGSRVLLTSRNLNEVAKSPRTFVHHLHLLNDEDSWVLFRRTLKVDIPLELMKAGKEIVIKCGGLPSEILKMGDLLSQKHVTEEEWSRVKGQLDQDDNNNKPWFETLDTINMNLPLYLKRCLFYFVLFPAGFVIPARRLIVLWVAEDLVHQGENEESSEHVAERYLTELIDLNMVQIIKRKHNGKVKSCRLPYALRELWLTKAEEYKFLQGHIDTNSDSSPKTCIIRRVADHLDQNDIYYSHIHGDTAAPSTTALRTYYKHVLSFLSFDAQEGSKPGEDIGNFLNRCISSNCFLLLRVLDLEHVYKPKLPKDIGRLSKLRYLGLRWTYLESLPSSIGNLLKLQTLDLKATNINTLPSSLWKMQLRHLYLSETYGSRFPPKPRGGSLSNIQTLWGLFLDEDSPVKDGLDRLVNIRKLGLVCQSLSLQQESMASQLDALAGWLLRLEHLQSLRLKSRNEEGQPWNLHLESFKDHKYLTDMYLLGRLSSPSLLSQFFPPSLIELTLAHSRLSEDPMQILNDLPNLRYLNLQAESYMGKTMLCCSGSFPQLRILKIWMLEQLEDWNIEQEALPCLRQLEIRSCQHLKMLPDGMQYVKALLELKLTSMPMQFKRRIEDSSSEDWHKISHIPNISKDDSQ